MNGSSKIQDGTAEGLFQFLDYVVVKGYGSSTAVGPWRSAIKQVVSAVEGTEDIRGVDVRALNVGDYLDRFETLARGRYKVESIRAYRRRFGNAVEAYLAFIDTGKPPTFRAPGTRRPKAEPTAAPSRPAQAEAPAAPQAAHDSRERMLDYPFPLRSGSVATLRLPARLEKADAERLALFMRTLVFEPVLELARGEEHQADS